MSRFIEIAKDETGEYLLETLADPEGCRWSLNDVCCNEKCDLCCDIPLPKDCTKESCGYFEPEPDEDIKLLTIGIKNYDFEEAKPHDLH